KYDYLKALEMIKNKENKNIKNSDKYLSQEEFKYLKALGLIENVAVLDTGIHFIQIRVSNPERFHDNFNLL
ncbi:29405_t:CDS:1, partial [Gigaspora margarita]